MVWSYFLFYSEEKTFTPFILSFPSNAYISEFATCVNSFSKQIKVFIMLNLSLLVKKTT